MKFCVLMLWCYGDCYKYEFGLEVDKNIKGWLN